MLILVLPREVIVHVPRTFINMRACVCGIHTGKHTCLGPGTIAGKHRYEEIKATLPPPPTLPSSVVVDKDAGEGEAKKHKIYKDTFGGHLLLLVFTRLWGAGSAVAQYLIKWLVG